MTVSSSLASPWRWASLWSHHPPSGLQKDGDGCTRPVRPVGQRLQPAVLVPRQPRVQRLTGHLPRRRDLGHRPTVADHRQHSLVPLLSHAHLPHQGSVKDQPKQLSSLSRNTVRHQPNTKRQASGGVIHFDGAPGRTRTCDLEIRRLLLYPLSYGGRHRAGCRRQCRCAVSHRAARAPGPRAGAGGRGTAAGGTRPRRGRRRPTADRHTSRAPAPTGCRPSAARTGRW